MFENKWGGHAFGNPDVVQAAYEALHGKGRGADAIRAKKDGIGREKKAAQKPGWAAVEEGDGDGA